MLQPAVPTEYRPWQTQMYKMYRHTVPARNSTILSPYRLMSYWAAMNRLNKVIQILILQFRTDCWIKACEDIHEHKEKKYWQTVKKLAGYNPNPPAADLIVDGVHIQENIDKADVFALHFKKAFSKSEEAQYDDVNQGIVDVRCHQFFTDTDHQHPESPRITHSELSDIIGKGKNTAPGYDKIPMSIVKRLDWRTHMLKLYNYCLANNYFPESWKSGIIITLPKPNTGNSLPENYRPITLLPTIGKIFEKIIK